MEFITPLMQAAWNAALESIDLLLDLGADANLLDINMDPALSFALRSNNLAAVKKLLPFTNSGIQRVFVAFAKSCVPFGKEIITFLMEKLAKDASLFFTGFYWASKYGNVRMVNVLKKFLSFQIHNFGEDNMFPIKSEIIKDFPEILRNSIESDKIEVCGVVKDICTYLKLNIARSDLSIAKKRGFRKIYNLFSEIPKEDNDRLDEELINRIRNKTASILEMIPKTDEFEYFPEMVKIIDSIKEYETDNDCILTFDKLLERMHVKKVHYDEEKCPMECQQDLKCLAVRESLILIKYLLFLASKEYKIFENTAVQIVGSIKENTKINELGKDSIN